MRQAGLLDLFPLFLFERGTARGATVVLDNPELGRLMLSPGPDAGRIVVAVAKSRESLELTRSHWDPSQAPDPLLVRADPSHPPFAQGAVAQLVSCDKPPEAWQRTLSSNGCITVLNANEDPERSKVRESVSANEVTAYVRPAVGGEYFVTGKFVPNPWPFRKLQLGRARMTQLWLMRLAARLGLGWGPSRLGRGITVRVQTQTESSGRLDAILGAPFPAGDTDGGLFVKAGWNALLLGLGRNETIGKLPLSDVATERMAEHADQLEALHSHETPALLSLVPRVHVSSRVEGQTYWVEEKLPGEPVSTGPLAFGGRRRTFEAATRLLLDLHLQTRHESFIWHEEFERLTKDHIERIWREGRRIDERFDLSRLHNALSSRLVGQRLPLVRTHGDYWPGNILVSRGGRISGVLDWDASISRGWPLLDLLHLLAFQNKRRAFWDFGKTVTGRLAAQRFRDWERSSVAEYCTRMEIHPSLWPTFIGLYWLERASQWLFTDFHEGRRNDAWVRRNVIEAVPHLIERIERDHSR
ncbi:aminoglycoside phosphotransferase family protein [Myxococcota bacterium]|nr:aminoglycoside phosphotransferase family protein [Myxococcota bacterium]